MIRRDADALRRGLVERGAGPAQRHTIPCEHTRRSPPVRAVSAVRPPCASASEWAKHVPCRGVFPVPCVKAAKIRVKNREPVPAYAMADADRDSDLGDDSPVVSTATPL